MKFHAPQTQDAGRANPVPLQAEAAAEGLLDHRPSAAAQFKLAALAGASEPVQRQVALNARVAASDRVVAQARMRDVTVQRAGMEEEEAGAQMKRDPVQRLEEDELKQAKFIPAQRVEEEEPKQMRASPVQRMEKENNTGLPNQLKSGVEALSGMSMDHVKVHYNSSQPAQLNALAYAQGSDIHVGPGQEKHLPHEAWHVVQQAQGRVQPTTQMKEGTPVNDDANLEAEADNMGAKAMQMRFGPKPGHHSN